MRFYLKFIYISSCFLSSISLAETPSPEKAMLVPDRLTASTGIKFRNTGIFSQENYFQDSWTVSGGVHWDFQHWDTEGILRLTFEKFMPTPRNKKQLGIDVTESHAGLAAGFENRSLIPLGLGSGIVNIKTTSVVSAGDYVTNQSASSRWTESLWVPALDLWAGLPLYPDRLQLNLLYRYLASAQLNEAKGSVGIDFRFEF